MKTGLDADVAELRRELEDLKTAYTSTIADYQRANSDLWARLNSAPAEPASPVADDAPDAGDVFNSIMRR